MEVNPILMVLTIYGRMYNGMTAEEGFACAQKAVDIAGLNPDVIDLIDAFEDVWAASLLAGTIREDVDSVPIHPLSERERLIRGAADDKEKDKIIKMPDDAFEVESEKPKRYKDKKYVAIVNKRIKKRRHWDKNDATLERK
jgi:hypothetical protein